MERVKEEEEDAAECQDVEDGDGGEGILRVLERDRDVASLAGRHLRLQGLGFDRAQYSLVILEAYRQLVAGSIPGLRLKRDAPDYGGQCRKEGVQRQVASKCARNVNSRHDPLK